MTESIGLAVDLRNMSAAYTDFYVLKDISIQVGQGEVCAIIGPNGAGKSTLLRSIMGLTPRVDGEIIIEGSDVNGESTHSIARRGVAFVPEGRGILNSLTVRENLLLASRRRGAKGGKNRTASEVVRAATDRFDILEERLDQPAGQLSGGQQQMLAIARVLARQPRLLLIDEPSLGLAPLIRAQVSRVLLQVASEDGITVLLAEQDIKMVSSCANRAYVLSLGRQVGEVDASSLTSDAAEVRQAYLGSGVAKQNSSGNRLAR